MRGDPDWLVPEHWRIEFLSTMRGLSIGGKLDPTDARIAMAGVARCPVRVIA